jgi:hypothetical protein
VYAVLFCNLIAALLLSILNTFIAPVFGNLLFIPISNSVNITSLFFHCCCWCVVSTLRYLYIIKKDWLERTFPDPSKLRSISLILVFLLFSSGASSMFSTVIYFGFPQTRVMHFPLNAKAACLALISCYFLLLILVSCYFYMLILRKRGKLGHNSVNVEESVQVSFTGASAQFMTNDNARISSAILDQESFKQQRKEIESAITSLKTNLIFSLTLIVLFIFGTLFSSDFLFLVFTLFKGQSPVWTTVFNFRKIQILVTSLLEAVASVEKFQFLHNSC